MKEYLLDYVLTNYPHVRGSDIEDAVVVNEYDILIKFKNGDRRIYDSFAHTVRGVSYTSDDLTEEQEKLEFKRNLQKIMNRKFINQEELAARIGTTQPMIHRYISGKSFPNGLILRKIAKTLNCSIDDLFYKHF